MATKQNQGQEEKITALYGRLSDDDGVDMESNSISNQRTILQDYAKKNGYLHPVFFYDDGVSGTTFERHGFKEMEALVEAGKVSTQPTGRAACGFARPRKKSHTSPA